MDVQKLAQVSEPLVQKQVSWEHVDVNVLSLTAKMRIYKGGLFRLRSS